MQPLSPRHINRKTATPFRQRSFDEMATPMFSHISQIPASFKCPTCGPVHFTMSVRNQEVCGDCGQVVVTILATSKKICPATVKLSNTSINSKIKNDENSFEQLPRFASDDVTPSVLSKQPDSVPSGIGSRRRRLFPAKTSTNTNTPPSTLTTPTLASLADESKDSSTTATTAKQRRELFATPVVNVITSSDVSGDARVRSPVCSIRVGVKLAGRFLLVRACRPPMTNGFYRISVTDVQTGTESEFISCAKERPAFEAWPTVDFVALLSNHYASSPKRAPFPYGQEEQEQEQKMTVNTEEKSLHDKENENDTAEMFATNNTLMEVSTMMQSPLRSSLQVTTEEEEVTAERTLARERPRRRPPPTPTPTNVSNDCDTDNTLKDTRIFALEMQLSQEQEQRQDCEERLSIVIEHSEHRLSSMLSEKEEHERAVKAAQIEKEQLTLKMTTSLSTLEQEMHSMKSEMTAQIQQEITTAKEKTSQALEVAINAMEAKKKMENECSNLRSEMTEKDLKIETLSTKMQGARTLRELCQRRNSQMEEQIVVMTQHRDVSSQYQLMAAEQATALQTMKSKYDESMQRQEVLKNEMEATQINLTTQQKEFEVEKLTLQAENSEMERQQKEVQDQHAACQRGADKITMDLEMSRHETQMLTQLLNEAKTNKDVLETTLKATWEIEKVNMQKQCASDIQAVKEAAVVELETQLAAQQLATQETAQKTAQQVALKFSEKILSIEQELKEKTLRLSEIENTLSTKETQQQAIQDSLQTSEQQVKILTGELNAFQSKLQNANSTISTINDKMKTINAERDDLLQKQQEAQQRAAESSNDPNYPKYSTTEYEEFGKQQLELGKQKATAEAASKEGTSEIELKNLRAQHQEEIRAMEEKNDNKMKHLIVQQKTTNKELDDVRQAKEEDGALALQFCEQKQLECANIQLKCDQTLQAKEEELVKNMSKLNLKVTNLNTLVASRNVAIKEKEQELQALTAQKENWQAEKQTMQEKHVKTYANLTEMTVAIDKHDQEMKQVVKAKTAVEGELLRAKKLVKSAKKSEEELKSYLEEELAKASNMVKEKLTEFRAKETKMRKLENYRKEMGPKYKAIMDDLEKERNRSKENNMKRSEELMKRKNDVDRFKKEYETSVKAKMTAEKQVLDLTSENADLECSMVEIKTQLEGITGENKFLMENLEAVMAELESARTEQEKGACVETTLVVPEASPVAPAVVVAAPPLPAIPAGLMLDDAETY